MSKITWEQLPKEIKERMLDCQVEQWNPRDEKVFLRYIKSDKQGKGFTWHDTKEGHNFWNEILRDGNIYHFYMMYPQQPKFQPIAMKCTQEQWDELKPELEKLEGVDIRLIGHFEKWPYIANNYHGVKGEITNVLPETKNSYNRTVHETFDKQLFLNSLGVKVGTETHSFCDTEPARPTEEKVQQIPTTAQLFGSTPLPIPTLPSLPYGAELICKEMEVSDDDKEYITHYVLIKEGGKGELPYITIKPNGKINCYKFAREIDPIRNELEAEIKELEKMIAERQEKVNKLKGE